MGRARWGAFLAGVLAGLLLMGVFSAGAVRTVERRGVTVTVQTEDLAEALRQEMRTAVRRELPGALESLRAELPRRIGAEAGQRVSAQRVDVAGLSVSVPAPVVQEVQAQVEEAARYGIDLALSEVDTEALGDRLADQGARLVEERLRSGLAGQTFPVQIWPWLTLPVTIVPE